GSEYLDISHADGAQRAVTLPSRGKAFPCRHPDRPSQHSRTARNWRSIFCDRPGLSRCRSATADHPARELAYSLAAGSSCERGARSFERRNAQVNDFERQPTLKNNIYFEKRAGEAQY